MTPLSSANSNELLPLPVRQNSTAYLEARWSF
jgi:hypothetical protein